VSHVVQLSDGTLKYGGSVSPPHDTANSSTKTYLPMDGGHVKAKVREDGAPVGSVGGDASTSSGTARGNKPA